MGDSMSWEPEPFSRIIWRWKVPYKYRTIVSRANRLAHWVEYEAVKRGLRKCDVVHIHPRDLPQRVREIMKDGLVWLPIRTMKSVSGFAHKFYQPSSLDETLYYGVVAHSMDEAKAFLEAHQSRPCDHDTIGELLGYPKCCREFFCKTFPRGELDPVHLVDSSKGQDPMLCVSLRYFGLRIIPFFPCSFNCSKAKQFAEQWYKLMLEKDPFTAKGILELLTMPHKWSMVNAIIEVVTPLFIGICNGYVRYQKAELYWKGDPEYWKKKLPLQWHWYQYSLGKRPPIKELKSCMQS